MREPLPTPLELRGDRIFVVAYKKPAEVGSLMLPQAHLVDESWVLWEVVQSSAEANQRCGRELQEGDILHSFGGHTGVDTGCYLSEEDRRDVRSLSSEEVWGVIPRSSWEEEDE